MIPNIVYMIKAKPKNTKYGVSYEAISLRNEKPTTPEGVYNFLSAILPPTHAKVLFEEYPNIIDMVKNNEMPDLSRLKGIKDATWARIREKILQNVVLIDIVDRFNGMFNINIIKKLYAKYSDAFAIEKKIKENPYYCLCGLSGVGFKTADEILLKMNSNGYFPYDLKYSEQRCYGAIDYVLRENEKNGNTRMNVIDLRDEVLLIARDCGDKLVDVIKNIDNYKLYYGSVGKEVYISRMKTYLDEYNIVEYVSEDLKLEDNIWEYDYHNDSEDSHPTEEQISIIDKICKNRITILNGCAGTGKTFTTKLVLKMADDLNKSYVLLAPTGKAAKVLSSYTGVKASTIHRELRMLPDSGCDNNLHDFDLVIVDEFSMVDVSLFSTLLTTIDFNKTKLLVIGDSSQLPSVGCGNILHDMLNEPTIPKVNLTKVFRYSEGGLMQVATDVRNSKKYIPSDMEFGKTLIFGDNKDYYFTNIEDDDSVGFLVKLYEKTLEKYKPEDILVLTAYRKGDYGCVELNKHLRKIANPINQDMKYIKCGNKVMYEGDIVIQNVNNYNVDVYGSDAPVLIANGESGIIRNISNGIAMIEFHGMLCEYTDDDIGGLDLGYAQTIHKSQGDSAKVVILLTPNAHTYMLNSNLIYVGLTRMKEKCFHIGNAKTINRAIKIKENMNRKTWFHDLYNRKENTNDNTRD